MASVSNTRTTSSGRIVKNPNSYTITGTNALQTQKRVRIGAVTRSLISSSSSSLSSSLTAATLSSSLSSTSSSNTTTVNSINVLEAQQKQLQQQQQQQQQYQDSSPSTSASHHNENVTSVTVTGPTIMPITTHEPEQFLRVIFTTSHTISVQI